MSININQIEFFKHRHNGNSDSDRDEMLKVVGVASIDELIDKTIPSDIRMQGELNVHSGISEQAFLENLREIAAKNQVFRSYIGQGYYNTYTPTVIQRNILENPGWYTQYTPYQAEIAQGRLEALLNFQTMVSDLTGMELANASLLDEGTAAAEAMSMFLHLTKSKTASKFFVDNAVFAQTKAVLETRAEPIGVEIVYGDAESAEFDEDCFGALVQYPDSNGAIRDYADFTARAAEQGVKVAVAADIMSLALLTPPGEWGAEAVVGSTQRFGIPLGFGGPHAAYFATKEE